MTNVEHRRARHISEIIREQDYPRSDARGRRAIRFQKIIWFFVDATLNVLATIGWLVTLPFITRADRALIAREQSRG